LREENIDFSFKLKSIHLLNTKHTKMSSIKIKNFGPIKEGFTDNDGFLPIDKVMIFIGGQGSGTSSLVKLISILTWVEKALFLKKITVENLNSNQFKEVWCAYQSIQNYFKDNSYIEYKGEYIHFIYSNKEVVITTNDLNEYKIPKVTFVPAERNFLSVIEEVEGLKYLPKTLSWTLEEYSKACKKLDKSFKIPINNIKFDYDKLTKTSFVSGDGFVDLKLSEASSGIQSVTPLFVVLDYLDNFLKNQGSSSKEDFSLIEREELEKQLDAILADSSLSKELKELAIKKLSNSQGVNHLFTIIEEIEQNLFPESQKIILLETLKYNNPIENHLILTTHSPYIIAYMTLSMKAFKVNEMIKNNEELRKKLNKIVPLSSISNPDKTGIYQIDDEGKVISIKSERGLILDNNFLNNSLEITNELFDELLDIEQLCK
jgi:hypothetical protein